MKATMGNDGFPRFDIRVTTRVGLLEMSNVLKSKFALDYLDGGIEGLPKKLTRADIMGKCKDFLWYHGVSGEDYWSDELSNEEIQELNKWADEVIIRAYPELKKNPDW